MVEVRTNPKLPRIATMAAVVSMFGVMASAPAWAGRKGKAQVVQTREGVVLRMAHGSKFRRMPATDLQIHPGSKTRSIPIRLDKGRIDVLVPAVGKRVAQHVVQGQKLEGKHEAVVPVAAVVSSSRDRMVIVEGGWATVMVRGTDLVVANHGGKVRLGTLRAMKEVRPGFVSVLAQDGREVGASLLPTAPRMLPSRRVLLSVGGKPVQVEDLGWSSVPGAKSYEVTVRNAATGAVVARNSSKRTKIDGLRLGPGAYLVDVVARDVFGFVSEKAGRAELRVCSVGLPLGGYVDEQGGIWIRPGQRILLTQVEGLIMSYPGGKHWTKASSDIGLYRNATRSVVIKHPGDQKAARIDLHAIHLTADVTMTPAEPVWPGQSVRVEVDVHTADGQPLPPGLKPFAQVTLGNTPLGVRWKRHGMRMTTVVPSRRLPGPRVLRVEVTDQFGLPLGRSFVEIAVKP